MAGGGRTRQFFRTLPGGIAIRVRFDLERGVVGTFVAQLEVLVGDAWLPAVRYDSAHGRPHRDPIARDGRLVAKHWLPEGIDANAALTFAEADLAANADRYRDEFLRRPL